MKKQFAFIFIVILTVLASCSKNDSTSTPATLSGTWKISSLSIDGIDKTSLVSAYTITFDDNGMMSVRDSVNTFDCNWSDNGGMMNGMDDFHFDMSACPDNSPMHELDADWVMDSQMENECSFHEKDSGNNILTLARI